MINPFFIKFSGYPKAGGGRVYGQQVQGSLQISDGKAPGVFYGLYRRAYKFSDQGEGVMENDQPHDRQGNQQAGDGGGEGISLEGPEKQVENQQGAYGKKDKERDGACPEIALEFPQIGAHQIAVFAPRFFDEYIIQGSDGRSHGKNGDACDHKDHIQHHKVKYRVDKINEWIYFTCIHIRNLRVLF